jgi:UDP-N-acetylglucosamine 2-epimerase (non-hydrolysing)
VGGGSDAVQIGLMLQRLEPALADLQPDVVLAYGDDRAAAAAALTAATLRIRFGHVEAGLRSGDGAGGEVMPRLVSDVLADLLFVPSRDAIAALKAEGVAEERIQFVGSVRIDALCWALARGQAPAEPGTYAVTSLHEPAPEIDQALAELGRRLPVVPAPAGYVERMGLVGGAALVVTDADDLQDETSFLGIPCITLRSHTDHPTTCRHGTNRLVAAQRPTLLAAANRALSRRAPARPLIERWDGRAAERIARVLCDGADFTSERELQAAPRVRRAVALPQMA